MIPYRLRSFAIFPGLDSLSQQALSTPSHWGIRNWFECGFIVFLEILDPLVLAVFGGPPLVEGKLISGIFPISSAIGYTDSLQVLSSFPIKKFRISPRAQHYLWFLFLTSEEKLDQIFISLKVSNPHLVFITLSAFFICFHVSLLTDFDHINLKVKTICNLNLIKLNTKILSVTPLF